MRHGSARVVFSFLVHDVSRMRRTFFDQALKPVGITRAQWWALGNICRHAEEGMTQTELANILETGKVSVGGLIDRLEEAGLIYRKSGGTDRRVKRIFITAKGYEILDQIALVGDELDRHVFADISEAELAAASDVLARVKQNIRAAIQSKAAASILAGGGAGPQV